jgi:hypothetical protein
MSDFWNNQRTTKTIERVARAISKASGMDPDDVSDGFPMWKLDIHEARAAVREMKKIEAERRGRRRG